MVGPPEVKQFWRYAYLFWHDPQTWQTDTHSDTAWWLFCAGC